jgi:RHS repeat-associated protein
LFDGQYTSADTGLIYLRARVYDPATAQFMSVDPLSAVTRMPYIYANANPLNVADPMGLCGIFDVVCDASAVGGAVATGLSHAADAVEGAETAVGGAVESGAEWVYEHPKETAGLVLGAASLATGVGAVADFAFIADLGVTPLELGAASAATGVAGAALDGSECLGGKGHPTVACVGFGLNAVGAGLGGAGTLVEAGLLEGSTLDSQLLEYGGLGAASGGLGADIYGAFGPGQYGCA